MSDATRMTGARQCLGRPAVLVWLLNAALTRGHTDGRWVHKLNVTSAVPEPLQERSYRPA